jgi:arsenite methyltransferase
MGACHVPRAKRSGRPTISNDPREHMEDLRAIYCVAVGTDFYCLCLDYSSICTNAFAPHRGDARAFLRCIGGINLFIALPRIGTELYCGLVFNRHGDSRSGGCIARTKTLKVVDRVDSNFENIKSSTPNVTNARSIQKYAKKAKLYDGTAHRTDWIRGKTIELLELDEGQTVLDVGCGSGLSFELLRRGVGKTGKTVGFDQSPDMLALAQRLVKQKGWGNVFTQYGFGESIHFETQFDAYLFHYTHDILQSPDAVENLLRFAKPNARIAIAGMKKFPIWLEPLNVYAFFKNFAWNGNGSGLRRPWRHIQERTDFTFVRATQVGMGYIATARTLTR